MTKFTYLSLSFILKRSHSNPYKMMREQIWRVKVTNEFQDAS